MLTVDGVPLDDAAGRFYVLRTGTAVRTPPGIVVSDVNVPGQHGVIPGGSTTYGPASAVVNMRVRGGSYSQMMANWAALGVAVGVRRTLRTLTDTEIAQSAGVQLSSLSPFEQVHRRMGDCTVTFSVPRAFWRDTGETTVDLGTTGGAKNPTDLQGGSAPILDPVFVTVGNGASTDFKVTDDASLSYVRWVGTVPAGQSVRIEPASNTPAWLVPSGSPWTGGTDASGLLDLGPGQFSLTPGSGFTITKTGSTQTQVRARRAYL